MEPLAVHHVSINVTDVDAALEFYTGVLGLRARTDRPDFGFGGAWLDVGGQQVHLIEGTTPPGHGQHFAILVADLDKTVGELRQGGVEVSDPRRGGGGVTAPRPVGPSRMAFLSAPAGNLIECPQAAG